MLSPIVRDVQRQRCSKRGSGDGQRLSLWRNVVFFPSLHPLLDTVTILSFKRIFMITARVSDLSMPLKVEVRRSPVRFARQQIARSGKFVRRAYSRRALDCEKDDGLTCMYAFSCMLSPIVIVEHTIV